MSVFDIFIVASGSFLLCLTLSERRFRTLFRSSSRIQDLHSRSISRLGGVAIITPVGCYVSLVFGLTSSSPITLIVLLSSFSLLIGLWDDLSGHVRPIIRISLLVLLAIAAGNLVGWLDRIDSFLFYFDEKWLPIVSWIATILAVVGLTNSFNLVDGLNGLTAGLFLTVLFGLYGLSLKSGVPTEIQTLLILCIASTLGFLAVNYPKGRIFLGDCGAYLIGFLITQLCILINSLAYEISSWSFFLLCLYPIVETVFTMIRRGRRCLTPDNKHLHQQLHFYLLNRYQKLNHRDWIPNSIASFLCVLFFVPFAFLAVYFCQNKTALIVSITGFCVGYLCLYGTLERLNRGYR